MFFRNYSRGTAILLSVASVSTRGPLRLAPTAQWGPHAHLGGLSHTQSDEKSLLWTFSTHTDTLTMSLPESEDTEDAEEPEERSWGLGRDKVRRWL